MSNQIILYLLYHVVGLLKCDLLWDFFRFPTPEEIGKGKQVKYVILIDKTLSSLGAVMS